MKFSQKILSQTITQLCLAKGIDHIVISPGSRNAPLTIGFTEHPSFKNFSIVDERCAAFFALGMAQQLKRPVALVCTSGSALLNYYPAIAEAFYSDIPLVVISADRPQELIDIGDGQTIRQENVFQNHILYSANCKEGEQHQVFNETELNIGLNTAIELQGPVHINAPFSEPLYDKTVDMQVRPQDVPARIGTNKLTDDLEAFADIWNASTKKMIVVGVLPPDSIEQQYIKELASDKSVIVFTETTSNLQHDDFFPAIDQLIAPLEIEEFKKLRPEVLLTFGGMVVSKKIKAFLRTYAPNAHWHVDAKKAYDTYFGLTHHFKVNPNTFFEQFIPKTRTVESSYRNDWMALKAHRLSRHEKFEETVPFSDFKAFSKIFNTLPEQINLQLSNSATIRYAQLFHIDSSVKVYCNRGTSGIDGSTSTAIGAATVSDAATIYITGDLSFFYDSNGLWNDHIPKNFKIIVINNSGGGIFRILPGAKSAEHFDTYFETRHQLKADRLCTMYGFDYTTAEDNESLSMTLNEFYEDGDSPKLLEIFTPSEVNDRVLLDYFQFIK